MSSKEEQVRTQRVGSGHPGTGGWRSRHNGEQSVRGRKAEAEAEPRIGDGMVSLGFPWSPKCMLYLQTPGDHQE